MKIIFIGSVLFSATSLEKLISIGAEVVGVITKKESKVNNDFFDLSSIAFKNKIPVYYTKDINCIETIDWVNEKKPDILFCFGWSNLIKKDILNIAPNGVIGFHPSFLPNNRGRHPLIWAKVLGLKKTGTTFFFMDEGADTGDILSQSEFEIDFNDDASILYLKMTNTAMKQIEDFHSKLINSSFTRTPQEKSAGNQWRKRGVKDGLIDFRMSTISICNLVRALSKPYVGAHIEFNEMPVSVWKVMPDSNLNNKLSIDNLEPGKVLKIQGQMVLVKTGDSAVWLTEHEFIELPKEGSYIK
jgi:methionyl-tRNA formyltransferase